MKKRIHWIDICRGIAIILVVIGHVVTSFHSAGEYEDAFFFNYLAKAIYTFHMPLFFAVSGYLHSLKTSDDSIPVQIRKRLIAYGIPYLIFSAVAFLLKFAARDVVNHQLSIYDLFGILLYPISSMWFLYALLVISIAHIFFQKIEKYSFGKVYVLTISFSLMFLAYLVSQGVMFDGTWIQDSFIVYACLYLFWFEAGALLFAPIVELPEENVSGNRRYLTLAWSVFEIVIFSAAAVMLKSHGIDNFLLYVLFAIAGTIAVAHLSMALGESKFIERLGQGTMEIYLIHPFVISATRLLLKKAHLLDPFGIVPLIVCTVLGVAIPMLLYMLIKRVKFLDFCIYPQRYIGR